MSNYTPTTADVRNAWLLSEYEDRDSTTSDDDLRGEFDRWLAEDRDKRWREGYAASMDDGLAAQTRPGVQVRESPYSWYRRES